MTSIGFLIYATLVVIGCVGDVAFLIMYTIRSRPKWWHSTVAAHVFAFSALFGALYIRTLLRLFNPQARAAIMSQSSGDVIFIFCVAVAAAAVVWWRLSLLLFPPKEKDINDEQERRDDIESTTSY